MGETPDKAAARPSLLGAVGRVALVGAAFSAAVTGYELGVYLPAFNTPHTSLEGVPHEAPPGPPNPGLARRLSVVVVDGLSYERASSLDGLWPLRRRGVFRGLTVEFPSYTSPALVSFMTGLTPRDSGTRRNGDLGGVAGLDSILLAAGDAHVPLRVFSRGFGDFAAIVAPPPGTPVHLGRFAPAVDMMSRGLAGAPELAAFDGHGPARALDLFHWGEVDETGHRVGAASREYREEAEAAAGFLVRYASTLDLDQDVLVVVSDHGHLPEGGHGGDEPDVSHAFFLGVGGLFRQGVALGDRPMRDVAATLAVIGGLRVPSSNLGLPMLDTLSLDGEQTAYLLARPFEEAGGFLCRLHASTRCAEVEPLVARLKHTEAAASEEAEGVHAALTRERDAELDARRARGGPVRLGMAAGLLALAGLVLGWRARRGGPRGGITLAATALPVIHVAVYVAFLAWRAYRATFSHLLPVPYFARDAVPAGALAVAAVAAFTWATRPGRAAAWVLLGAVGVPFVLLCAWVGADPQTVPPNAAGVLVFLLGPAMPAAAVGALVVAGMEGRRGRIRSGRP